MPGLSYPPGPSTLPADADEDLLLVKEFSIVKPPYRLGIRTLMKVQQDPDIKGCLAISSSRGFNLAIGKAVLVRTRRLDGRPILLVRMMVKKIDFSPNQAKSFGNKGGDATLGSMRSISCTIRPYNSITNLKASTSINQSYLRKSPASVMYY